MADYITVSEFKTYNPKVDLTGVSDTTLSGMITRGSRRVDEFTDNSFGQTTETDEKVMGVLNYAGDFVYFPRKKPIKSISSLSIFKGPISIDVTLTQSDGTANYTIPSTEDRVVLPLVYLAYNSVTIFQLGLLRSEDFFFKATYVAGEASIPESVKDATSLYVLDILARGYNLSGATRVQQGGISISYGNTSGKSDFVKDAELLLSRYKRVSGF